MYYVHTTGSVTMKGYSMCWFVQGVLRVCVRGEWVCEVCGGIWDELACEVCGGIWDEQVCEVCGGIWDE